MKRLTFLLICVVAIIALAAWWMWAHSARRMVQKRFTVLSELVSKQRGENPVSVAVRAQRLQGCFTRPAVLNTAVGGLRGELSPTEIASNTMAARNFFSELTLSFPDIRVDIPSRDVARARVTARLQGHGSTGETVDEIRELDCVLRKESGEWLFAECSVVQVLQK